MRPSLSQLEQQKRDLQRAFAELGDLRPGSITGVMRRCGEPSCHCASRDDPGHGPYLRMTYKIQTKTITVCLPTPAAIRKVKREIAEFRKFQQLIRDFVAVNEQICRSRPVEETLTPEGEKRPRRPSKRSHTK